MIDDDLIIKKCQKIKRFISLIDCTLLGNVLDRHPNHLRLALKEFSDSRWQDAQAICDLAMYNYTEVSLYSNDFGILDEELVST